MSEENDGVFEHQYNDERREKIAAHIASLRIARHALDEEDARQEAIQEFEARDYQLDAFHALWSARESGARRGLIHLATGLGKTSIAVVDYAAFRQEVIEAEGRTPRAMFVVHQNNILEQARERFHELLPEATQSAYRNRQRKLPASEITFASFQTLVQGAGRLPADYFDYIIYDEAHHIEANTYKRVVEYFKPVFQLGLTATPERMDEKDITQHFGEALYSKSLPEAIADGNLATVNYNLVYDEAVKEAIQKDFDPTTLAEIQRLFDVEIRNEVIVEKIKETQDLIKREQGVEQVKTIIFCNDVEHSDDIALMMDGMSYHSGKNSGEQDNILSAFRNNGLETITVRDMFNEGVDIPDARLIVFLRTTQSATVFEQQLGRGLRKNKKKQEVTVLDFVANIERIAIIRALAGEIDKAKTRHSPGSTLNAPKKTTGFGSTTVIEIKAGLQIHGPESEFIFSQEIINLLEKYNAMKETEPAPEGYISVEQYEALTGASRFVILKAIEELGIHPAVYRFGTRNGIALSEEQVALLNVHPNISIPHITEEVVFFTDAADRLEVSQATLRKWIKELGWSLPTVRLKNGMRALGINPEQYKVLEDIAAVRGTEAEEGWMSMNSAAQHFDVSRKLIKAIVAELGITTVKKKFYSASSDALNPEQVALISEHPSVKIRRAPEGWTSIHKLAVKNKVSDIKLTEVLGILNIETVTYKFGPVVAEGISPEVIETIEDYLSKMPRRRSKK